VDAGAVIATARIRPPDFCGMQVPASTRMRAASPGTWISALPSGLMTATRAMYDWLDFGYEDPGMWCLDGLDGTLSLRDEGRFPHGLESRVYGELVSYCK